MRNRAHNRRDHSPDSMMARRDVNVMSSSFVTDDLYKAEKCYSRTGTFTMNTSHDQDVYQCKSRLDLPHCKAESAIDTCVIQSTCTLARS